MEYFNSRSRADAGGAFGESSGERKKIMPDRETQCGNCHEFFEEGDQYCRFCGTKKGEGAFEPYYNYIQ
ncbi:MAG: hypothetical protein HUJ76_12985, partial [Parasporobacterium sp.]|nr:hypothetical protein [Parasporobacterium sp.]